MNDDLLVSWLAVDLDIGGQPANVLGYYIYDMRSSPQVVADVTSGLSHTLVGYVADPSQLYPVAVAAYNAQGIGPMSATVVPGTPAPSVPGQVLGVTAVIVPK